MTLIIGLKELKEHYEEFKKNPPQDTFSKLYDELNIVKAIIETVEERNLDIDISEYQKIADNNLKQLHEMGYTRIS